ncbi:MAG TPA: PIN domain-containing protein [Vicinamibacteria bacterium]
MGRLIADRHAIVWYLTAPRRLGAAARRALEAADEGRTLCCVPATSLVEIELLRERGRVGVGVESVLQALAGRPGYAVLALDADQAVQFAGLVGLKDPMDRLVVAAARATRSPLISIDEALDGFGVERVWD